MNSEKNDVFQGNSFQNHNDLIEYFLDMFNKASESCNKCKILQEYKAN